MAARVQFFVPGPIRPKARPRRGQHGNFYTPRETTGYEHTVKIHALKACNQAGWLLASPHDRFEITLRLRFQDKKARDLDNAAKSLLDACNDVVYKDDKQVDVLHVYREKSFDGPPGVLVEIVILAEKDRYIRP